MLVQHPSTAYVGHHRRCGSINGDVTSDGQSCQADLLCPTALSATGNNYGGNINIYLRGRVKPNNRNRFFALAGGGAGDLALELRNALFTGVTGALCDMFGGNTWLGTGRAR